MVSESVLGRAGECVYPEPPWRLSAAADDTRRYQLCWGPSQCGPKEKIEGAISMVP